MRHMTVWLVLMPLTRINHALRRAGLAADRWFWAEGLMLKWGYWWDGTRV